MANPYTSVAVSGSYNQDPPPDDASEVSGNQVEWDKHKEKLSDPLKTALESINTNVVSAFGKRLGTTFELKSANYQVAAPGDQGKFFSVTGTTTITLPAVGDAGEGFGLVIINNGSGTVTVDGSGAETIDGSASISLAANEWTILTTDGSTWTAGIVRAAHVDPTTRKVKTANTSKTSDTTLADDTHLAGFELEAGKLYSIEAWLYYTHSVGNFQYSFQFSQSPQDSKASQWATDESGTQYNDVDISLPGTAVTITTMTDGEFVGLKINGYFQANATTGGTLDFQWSQETSSANDTRLEKGSWMKVTKLN